MLLFDAKSVLEEVRRLKAQYPDAVYESPDKNTCFYTIGKVKNGPKTKGCLLGQAIRRVHPALFKRLKKKELIWFGGDVTAQTGGVDDVGLTGGLHKLIKIQIAQDNGTNWGNCKE